MEQERQLQMERHLVAVTVEILPGRGLQEQLILAVVVAVVEILGTGAQVVLAL